MSNHLKQILLSMCLSVFVGLLFASPFQVLEETPDYIKVKFTLPAWKLESVREDNQQWQQISCELGNTFAQEGYPLLKSFSEAVGIPVDGDISIEVLAQKKETVPNVKLYPAKKMNLNGTDISYSFYQDLKAYNSNSLYPTALAKKGTSAYIGNRNMVPLQLYPFQYNASRHELLVTTETELIIHIAGNKTLSRNWQTSIGYIDNLGDSFFLNNRTSQTWRKAKDAAEYIPKPRTSSLINDLQFIVDQEGIYKITYQYLTDKMNLMADSLGVEYTWSVNSVDPRYLQLSNEYGPVAIHFSGEADGSFDENDFFEFYGDKHYGDTSYQDEYTAENVYTLSFINDLGARLAVENGGLTISNAALYIVPDAYQSTVHLEQQFIPDKLGRSWSLDSSYNREDTWFWRKITAPNLEIIPFELQYPKDTTIRTLSTKLSVFGLTYMENLPIGQFDHKATIRLNQSLISTKAWRDQTEQIFENDEPLPNSYLQHGTNYYYLSMNGDTPMGDREQVMLDYIELTYWREFKTSEDFIKFAKPANRPFGLYQFKVEGFTSNQVSLYKIGSSVFNNLQIEPFTLVGSQPWTVTFQDSVISNDVRYYAVEEQGKKQPKDFKVNIPSYWHTSDNAADCLILTDRKFIDDEGTLLYRQLWENQGYVVEVIDVQDVYDEFNHGIKSATAIKDFFTFAYNNWQAPQLKSVILLGDGTDDERDNSSSRKYNIVPVKKLWTYKHGATASDNWYGCIVGSDPISDISISRIPIWESAQINPVALKSQNYSSQPNFSDLWHGHVVLASGGKSGDGNDIFAQQSEVVRRTGIPEFYRTSRIYTNTQTVSHDYYGVTSTLMSRINEGTIFLQFMGHGGGRIWADYNLFNLNNVSSLNNQNYPIVSSLACYCSAFDTPGASSISEALILQPEKGAIATVGFSGLGYLYDDLDFGIALTEGLFGQNFSSLGDAINFTKAKFYVTSSSFAAQQALTIGCAVLGDANIKLIKPQTNVIVNTDKDNYAVGDTLKVTSAFPMEASAARTFVLKETEVVANTPYDLPVIQGEYNFSYPLPGTALESYQRKLFVAGYSDQSEYYGFKEISFGKGLITHLNTIPEQPAWSDTIKFKAKLTGISNISNMICRVRTDSTSVSTTWVEVPMTVSQSDTTIYQSISGIIQPFPGKVLYFKYKATLNDNTTSESVMYSFVVAGPELLMSDLQFVAQNEGLGARVLVRNIGNAPSSLTDLKLVALVSGQPSTLITTIPFAPLGVNAERWETIPIDTLLTNNVILEARVNVPRVFPEWSPYNDNNSLVLNVPMNYHFITQTGGLIASLDDNLTCEIPANMVDVGDSTLFYINTLPSVTANAEPDVYPIVLKSGTSSIPYEIKTLDNSLIDTTGVFIDGKKLKLTFFYSPTDSLTQITESENSFKIFRWESAYRKWVIQGGNMSVLDDKVIVEVSKQGIYSLLRTLDRVIPSIDVNVQDQEFTVGGYVSGKGTISLILSDANGINIFDNSIRLSISDGSAIVEVPENQWVMTVNQNDINRIPIKYQLNLPKGSYTLIVDCNDVNGKPNTRHVKFIVNDKFDVDKLANYPNPVLGTTQDPKNAGRTRFTYVLTDDATEVTIKLYTVSGRLVKTLKNLPTGVGYHEYPRTVYAWDCVDDQGFFLANGVYFYKIIAKKGSKTIEKTQAMAILK